VVFKQFPRDQPQRENQTGVGWIKSLVSFLHISGRISRIVLFTDLPDHLTYVCWILFRTMPFGCALVLLELHHAPVSVSKLTNPHSTLDDRSLVCSMPQNLSSNYHNPAYNVVFNPKFSRLFHNKPNQIPPLSNSISSDLHTVGFKKNLLYNQSP